MTIEKFYEEINGNINNVLERIPSKDLICKIVKMFKEDPSKKILDEGIKEKDVEKSFRAIHTLKGVALNLGLGEFTESCINLTEDLRPLNFQSSWQFNYQKVCIQYDKIINLINELE